MIFMCCEKVTTFSQLANHQFVYLMNIIFLLRYDHKSFTNFFFHI